MLSKDKCDYIKNLSYYYITHFSRFIKPNAKRIAFSKYTDKIELTAFKNQDNSIVIVLLNRNDINYEYNICLNNIVIHDNLDSHAIVSYVIHSNLEKLCGSSLLTCQISDKKFVYKFG